MGSAEPVKEADEEEENLNELAEAAWKGDTEKVAKLLEREDASDFLNILNSKGFFFQNFLFRAQFTHPLRKAKQHCTAQVTKDTHQSLRCC